MTARRDFGGGDEKRDRDDDIRNEDYLEEL